MVIVEKIVIESGLTAAVATNFQFASLAVSEEHREIFVYFHGVCLALEVLGSAFLKCLITRE
jgi:hypothetical protein